MNKTELTETIQSYDNSVEGFCNAIAKLTNYNETYDALAQNIQDNCAILELASGPAQISAYILKTKKACVTCVDLSKKMLAAAEKKLKKCANCITADFCMGNITDFSNGKKYDAVILGFGIPYLDSSQAEQCIKNAAENLTKNGSIFYISFMEGTKCGFEKTSFGGENKFFINYHTKQAVQNCLEKYGFSVQQTWALPYTESDGSVTTDRIFLCRKMNEQPVRKGQ